MANWSTLKAAVADVINTNGNQAITGQLLQNVLDNIITNVGENSTFAGIATVGTNPGAPDGPVFYLATTVGTYPNFNGIEVLAGEAVILEWKNNTWTKKAAGFATKENLKIKSNIAFLSCESENAIVVEGSTVTFNEGWDIYIESKVFRASAGTASPQTITLHSGSGFIYFDIRTNTFFSGSNQNLINANTLVVGYNRYTEVFIFANQYTDNGKLKTLATALESSEIDAGNKKLAVTPNLLAKSFYKDCIAVFRGKVTTNGASVILGTGYYYFYNKHTAAYLATNLNTELSFTLSSSNDVLVYNTSSKEFALKSFSNIEINDIICLMYDGVKGICGGQWYEYKQVEDLKSVATPLDVIRHKYLPGISTKSGDTVLTEFIPVLLGDSVTWTSSVATTSISLREIDENYIGVDQWTAPSGTRTITITNERTKYVRAIFSFKEEYRDQTIYVNNVLKANFAAIKNPNISSAYFCSASIYVNESTREVTIKEGSDIYIAMNNVSTTFYRFASDYTFTLDSGGTNQLWYNYKLHTLVSSDRPQIDSVVIGVKKYTKLYVNGYAIISYSGGDKMYSQISHNEIRNLVSSENIPSFVSQESLATYKRVMSYLGEQNGYLLAQITDVHSGGTEKYKHVGYLNSLNKTWQFDVLCNAGDIGLDVGETDDAAFTLLYQTKSLMNTTTPWLYCKGNHERLRSMMELGNIFMKPAKRQFPQIKFGDSNGLYGYIDNEDPKVRTIYLNTSDTDSRTHYAISDEQVIWLGNTLMETANDYKIVILTHLCPKQIGEWTDYPGDWKTASDIVKVIEGYSLKQSVTHSGRTWNFANKSAKIVCVLSGDSHFNNSTKENGVNYIVRQGYGGVSTASKPSGATSDSFNYTTQCLFDILVIKDDSNAKIFRIGAGGESRDLEFTF